MAISMRRKKIHITIIMNKTQITEMKSGTVMMKMKIMNMSKIVKREMFQFHLSLYHLIKIDIQAIFNNKNLS